MDREEIIKAVTKIYRDAQAAIEEIDVRAHDEKAPHFAKASDAEATLRMLDAIIPTPSTYKQGEPQPITDTNGQLMLSSRNAVADAAQAVMEEAGDSYMKAYDIAEKVAAMGLHLGDSEADRTRRITVCLSAFSTFEAQRGAGWRLTARLRQTLAASAASKPSAGAVAGSGTSDWVGAAQK